MAGSESSKPNSAERQNFLALVQTAIKKRQAKQQLTPKEARAFDRYEAEEDERRGVRYLTTLPKKTYCSLVGRQAKVVNDQADTFGVPLRGATVNGLEVLKWIHDFFAAHKYELPAIIRGEGGQDSPREQLIREQIEVYRRRVILLENKIAVDESILLPRAEVHELLVQLARILRGAGERLHKQFGPQAASILEVALGDFDATMQQLAPKSGEAHSDLENATPAND